VNGKGVLAAAGAILAMVGGVACDEGSSRAEERGATAVELCRGHGGVAALDDDIVICRDQTIERGEP
jgi:hypothetical protein